VLKFLITDSDLTEQKYQQKILAVDVDIPYNNNTNNDNRLFKYIITEMSMTVDLHILQKFTVTGQQGFAAEWWWGNFC